MKTIKVLIILGLSFGLSACGLNNSSDDTLVANQLRGSRTGNVAAFNNKKAIDLNISKPSSSVWGELSGTRQALEGFLSIAEGQNITLGSNITNIGLYFWGSLKSTKTKLNLGSRSSVDEYFNSLDQKNFQFELEIWDNYTGGTDSNGNKIDYLGYAYMGRSSSTQVGSLSGFGYQDTSYGPYVGVKFTDSLGDIIVEGQITVNSSNVNGSLMDGKVSYRSKYNSQAAVLGTFSNLPACKFFVCQ